MKRISTKSLVFTALCIAIVAVCTMVVKIHIPSTGGYVNFGDIMIFSVAITLGKKKGAIAGGIGSCIADLLLGYIAFAPGTLIIKAIEGFLCGLIYEALKDGINRVVAICISGIIAGAFMVFGYFTYETVLFGMNGALGAIVGNLIQGGVSALAAVPISIMLSKATKGLNQKYAA